MTSARDLTLRLADLLRRERAALAEFLVALSAFDRERRWLELGHASLFYFLHRELGLSRGAAFYRKTAAELIQRFPSVVEPLRDGRLCLTSVVELAKVLTPENEREVLPRFFQLSKQEAKAVAAAIRPAEAAPHREVVTALRTAPMAAAANRRSQPAPERRAVSASGTAPATMSAPGLPLPQGLPLAPSPAAEAPRDLEQSAVHPDEPRRLVDAHPPVRSSSSEPITADLSRLHVTVSRRFLDKLEAARAALSHSHPGADAQVILEAGLDLVLDAHAKRKGLVKRPRREPPPAKPEHVPAHVKRAVWQRDGGRCQWPLEGGGVCGSVHQVEPDHVVPRARGGPSTVENARLLCRVHNDLAARHAYGHEWMDRFTFRAPATATAPGPWLAGP